jgi:hypothetical protein
VSDGAHQQFDLLNLKKLRIRRLAWHVIRLDAADQAFQRLDSDVPVAVPYFGERRGSKRDLGEWWQPFVNEPLEPAQRRSLVARGISVRQQFAQRSASASDSPPISRAAISAFWTLRWWIARWKRPYAVPCDVMVEPLGRRLSEA